MQVILNVKESFRITGSGHNREVVALYRWPLVLVPLYTHAYFCHSTFNVLALSADRAPHACATMAMNHGTHFLTQF